MERGGLRLLSVVALTLGAACGGDRAVAPAAVPSVSTADLPPGTIRREYTPPEQLGLWTRADSLTVQQGMERARRQATHLTAAQRRDLLANPLLDDYPVLRVAMTATSEADVNRVLLPALRRLVTVSSLDGDGDATAGKARGARYSYKGQALLSVRFPDARTMQVSVEGTPHGDALAVSGTMGTVAAESGTMSLQDLALLVAGITAMQVELIEIKARIDRVLSSLKGRAVANIQIHGGTSEYGCQSGRQAEHVSRKILSAAESVFSPAVLEDDCFDKAAGAALNVIGAIATVEGLGSKAAASWARVLATGSTAAAAATAAAYITAAGVVALTAYTAYKAISCFADEATFRESVEGPDRQAPMLRDGLARTGPRRIFRV